MSYTKHNYKKGDELLASQLNDMDDQIALNEQTADILVTVANTQPSQEKNRVWVKTTPSEIEIPTMEDMDEVSHQLSDLEDTVSTTQIINTASGAIASFSDGADSMPIKKLVAQIEPVQDLHGYDNPWPAGGGKNKACDIFSQYTKPDNYYILPVDLSASSTWQFHATQVGSKISGIVFGIVKDGDRYSNFVGMVATVNSDGDTFSYNINVDSSFVSPKLVCYCSDETQFNQIFANYHIQLEAGSTATAYASYSNECPISGWTGAEVTRTGKNLLNPAWLTEDVSTRKRWAWSDGIKLKGGNTYTFSAQGQSGVTMYINSMDGNALAYAERATTFMPQSDMLVKLQAYRLNGINDDVLFQLELGSTATNYEPYTGNQISVTFPTTIYGGEDEVISGKLKSTMELIDLGTLSWTLNTATTRFQASLTDAKKPPNNYTKANMVCSVYPTATSSQTESQDYDQHIGLSQYGVLVVRDTRYADAVAFKTAMSGVQLCYELAEPVEYTLTGNEMDTLYGTNNIWSSTGDTEVTYPADTKLYIDGKLAELQATILENIGG